MNSKVKKAAASAAIALSLSAAPTHAAVEIFLDIKGIPGESTNADFKGKIEVLAWGWGCLRLPICSWVAVEGLAKPAFKT